MSMWQAIVNHLAPAKSPFLEKPMAETAPEFHDKGIPSDGSAYISAQEQRDIWMKEHGGVAPAPAPTATSAPAPAAPRPIPTIQADVKAAAQTVQDKTTQIAAHQAVIVSLQADLASAKASLQGLGAEMRGAIQWTKDQLDKALADGEAFLKEQGL